MKKVEDRCYLDWEVADRIAIAVLKDQLAYAQKERLEIASLTEIPPNKANDLADAIELIAAIKRVLEHFGEEE